MVGRGSAGRRGQEKPPAGKHADERPRLGGPGKPAPVGTHCGGQGRQRVTELGRLDRDVGEHRGIQPRRVVDAAAAQPLHVRAADPPKPAAHGGGRAVDVTGDRAVPRPRALATRAAPTTSVASARRGWHDAGSRTWVDPHEVHRARRGRTNRIEPSSSRIRRTGAQDHGRSEPAQRGQPIMPAAKSASAWSSSSTTITARRSSHGCGALAVAREIGDRYTETSALDTLGRLHAHAGRYTAALNSGEQALAIARVIEDRHLEASALNSLGEVLAAAGQPEAALPRHRSARTVAREADDRDEQARALAGLGQALHATGHAAEAHQHWQEAFAIYTDLGVPDADMVRARMPVHSRQ